MEMNVDKKVLGIVFGNAAALFAELMNLTFCV
jgi:hypothetical protein